MPTATLLLIVTSVVLTASAQLLLKIGMSHAGIKSRLDERAWGSLGRQVVANPWVVSGLAMYVLGAALWLLVLAKVQLSFAYPFVGLGFIVTMLLGWRLLGDAMSVQRVAGTLLISAGVVLVASGG
jgi:drug/metabolite transporter (DMT)-like permease